MPNELVKSELSENWSKNLAVAEQLVKTGFLPPQIKTAQQALLIIETGRELNIPPMEALRNIFIVDNKTALASQLMLSLIYRSEKLEDIQIKDGDKSCTVTMKRKGMSPYSVTFTEADARQANLLYKTNWKNYPSNMLRARAISMCARVTCPDIIANLYTPEEIEGHLDTDEITHTVEQSKMLTQDDEYSEWLTTLLAKIRYELSQMTEPEQVERFRSSIKKELQSMIEADRLVADTEITNRYNELITGNSPVNKSKIEEYKEGANNCESVDSLISWFKLIQTQAIEELSNEELKELTAYCSVRKKLLMETPLEAPEPEPIAPEKVKDIFGGEIVEEEPPEIIVCSNTKCSTAIMDEKVIEYSKELFGRILCRNCQNLLKQKRA